MNARQRRFVKRHRLPAGTEVWYRSSRFGWVVGTVMTNQWDAGAYRVRVNLDGEREYPLISDLVFVEPEAMSLLAVPDQANAFVEFVEHMNRQICGAFSPPQRYFFPPSSTLPGHVINRSDGV
jgi:hypothetical protein